MCLKSKLKFEVLDVVLFQKENVTGCKIRKKLGSGPGNNFIKLMNMDEVRVCKAKIKYQKSKRKVISLPVC